MAEEKKTVQQDIKLSGWTWSLVVVAIIVLLVSGIGFLARSCSVKAHEARAYQEKMAKNLQDAGIMPKPATSQEVATYDWSTFRNLEFSPEKGKTYRIVFDKPDTTGWINFIAHGPMRYDAISEKGHILLTDDGRTIPIPPGDAERNVWIGYVNRFRIQSTVPQTVMLYTRSVD